MKSRNEKMAKLDIGWSEVSITPDNKIALAGQFAERISEYVETPITVMVLAVTDGEEQLIICSCDLVDIGENLIEDVRKAVKGKNCGIDTDKIIISAIHTHSSHLYTHSKIKGGVSGYKILISSFIGLLVKTLGIDFVISKIKKRVGEE